MLGSDHFYPFDSIYSRHQPESNSTSSLVIPTLTACYITTMPSAFPESFQCPITQDIMRDPVICPDGYTYEKSAIVLHLRSSSLSPMTRQAINSHELIPNRALKDAIEAWLHENSDHEATVCHVPLATAEEVETFSVTLQLQVEINQKDFNQDVLCMVVDISGSMNVEPTLKDLAGNAIQGASLSKLEMVRHAVKVAITCLPLGTHIGVMAYDEDVYALVPFTQITNERDREIIIKQVSLMDTRGYTDIYKALEFSIFKTLEYCERTKSIKRHARRKMWLLTDGLPWSPCTQFKQGAEIVEGLKELFDNHSGAKDVQISTFGFGSGTEIETNELELIARMTGGSFGK
jgi:hypothetical protein